MSLLRFSVSFIIILVICSCSNNREYSYSINDFRLKLRPYLQQTVDKGIVSFSDGGLESIATDNELVRMGKSEHPILRATAFGEMLRRKSFDHFTILWEHLDDTAVIFADEGEFGIREQTVSDFILSRVRWKTLQEKQRTVEQVLFKHNYLVSASLILIVLEPQEKFYEVVKDMATRPRRTDFYREYLQDFAITENALLGLAKFRKNGDVKVIKEIMKDNVRLLSFRSLRLMKDFPDTAYFDVLQHYYNTQFYRLTGNSPYGFSGGITDTADPSDFIAAVVAQQTEKSATLLDDLITYLPKQNCIKNKEMTIDFAIREIWKHPCPAYTRLREKIAKRAIELDQPPLDLPTDGKDFNEEREVTYGWYP